MIATLTGVALAAGAVVANATGLALTVPPLSSMVVATPCAGPAVVGNPAGSGSYSTVTLQMPAECVAIERSVQVTIVDGANVPHSSVAVVMSSPTQTVAVSPAYTAAPSMTVRVTLDGWDVPSSWAYTAPLPQISCRIPSNPAYTCTATITRRWFLVYYYDVRISAPAGQPSAPWEVTLNLDAAAFGDVSNHIGNYPLDDGDVVLASGSGCATAPIARLVGTGTSTSATAFRNVSSGQSRTLHLAIGDAGTAEVMACP